MKSFPVITEGDEHTSEVENMFLFGHFQTSFPPETEGSVNVSHKYQKRMKTASLNYHGSLSKYT